MTGTLLVTPDTEFEAQVKRAFDGDLEAERWWDAGLPHLTPESAVRMIASTEPEVVVIGPDLPPPAALALAEAFDLLHPEVFVVLVAKRSTRLLEGAVRAGVREIIPTGAGDDQIVAALTRAREAASRRRVTAPAPPQAAEAHERGRVITVMAPKGGAGKTTVATNLFALVGPYFPAEAEEVAAETASHVIDILAKEFSYVVVDTAAGLDEYTLAAADRSDDLVLVCVTDVPSVRGLRKALDPLDLLGMTKQRRHLVLNRSDDKVGLSNGDVEATIGLPVEAAIPTSRSIQISVNQGAPIVQSEPKSPAARSLSGFAQGFVDNPSTGGGRGGRRFSRKDGR